MSKYTTINFPTDPDKALMVYTAAESCTERQPNSLEVLCVQLHSELEALRACEDCTKQEIEIKELKGFLNDIANHDWDLSEMGAEEIYRGACELEKKLYHLPAPGQKVKGGGCDR